MKKRVNLRGVGLVLLLFSSACLPAEDTGPPSVIAVAHEQYPDFEQFSDTLPPVLSGTGARADWSGDEGSQSGKDLTHSVSSESPPSSKAVPSSSQGSSLETSPQR